AIAKFLIPANASEDLAQLYFVNPQATTAFNEQAVGEWKEFGRLNLKNYEELSVGAMQPLQTFHGGGAYFNQPLAASDAYELEATIQVPKASQNIVAQVFVTDDPTFDGDSATSPHELVWTLRNGEASVVLPNG